MKSKPRLGRKDIFIDSQVSRKEESRIIVKPEKKKTIKPEKQRTRIPETQKRIKVTFQIPENLFIQIKIKAAKERKKISELAQEIFTEYLRKRSDL
jgi:hypothetical protein